MTREMQEQLIRKGAEAELAELEARMGTLREVLGRGPRPAGRTFAKPGAWAHDGTGRAVVAKKKRSGMSAAARAAVSRRMKAYWSAKRKEK